MILQDKTNTGQVVKVEKNTLCAMGENTMLKKIIEKFITREKIEVEQKQIHR